MVAALAAKHGRSASQILGRWWAPQKPRKTRDIGWMNVIYIKELYYWVMSYYGLMMIYNWTDILETFLGYILSRSHHVRRCVQKGFQHIPKSEKFSRHLGQFPIPTFSPVMSPKFGVNIHWLDLVNLCWNCRVFSWVKMPRRSLEIQIFVSDEPKSPGSII